MQQQGIVLKKRDKHCPSFRGNFATHVEEWLRSERFIICWSAIVVQVMSDGRFLLLFLDTV